MLSLNFNPFPILQTDRTLLRKIELTDAPAVFFLRSDETVLKYINKEPAKTLQEAEKFIMNISENADKGIGIMWAITLKGEPEKLIGNICFWRIQNEDYRAEIGYTLHPSYWKKGIMKEVMKEVIDYGFTKMKLHSIEARINPENIASATLLEKTGFVREAYFKEDFCYKGKFLDTAVYSLLDNG